MKTAPWNPRKKTEKFTAWRAAALPHGARTVRKVTEPRQQNRSRFRSNLIPDCFSFRPPSVSRQRLQSPTISLLSLVETEGNPRIGLIERLLSEPRRLIVTILIGNEFVNVAASVISAAMVIHEVRIRWTD